MIQPVERGGGEYKLPGQYPALEQNRNRISDNVTNLLAGHGGSVAHAMR
jgi:hypothetical protein